MVPESEHIDVAIESAGTRLPGILGLPAAPRGLVLIANGTSSGRFSSRSRYLASALEEAGLHVGRMFGSRDGVVIFANPGPGSEVEPGTRVDLILRRDR